jgi:hypothetical protein
MPESSKFWYLKKCTKVTVNFYSLKWETHIFKYVYQLAAAEVHKLYVNVMLEGLAKINLALTFLPLVNCVYPA